jgi:(2R)-ethylmalonyl-CoA mutase
MQQVLAYETDLLEYPDLLDGSKVIEERTASLMDEAQTELSDVLALGGAFEAIDELKGRLVRSEVERTRRIESGELPVVGVNRFTTTEPSPLDGAETILRVNPSVEAALIEDVQRWRTERDQPAVQAALDELRRVAEAGTNIMPATIALAHAGGTTGEWAAALREVFGEFRAPTGVAGAVGLRGSDMAEVTAKVKTLAQRMGGPPKLLVAKPGLDGIRSTPAEIAAAARDEDVDMVGLSILSGSHLELVPEVIRQLKAAGVAVPVVVGGIIPEEDAAKLREEGVAGVYTPKDFQLTRIMSEMADLLAAR